MSSLISDHNQSYIHRIWPIALGIELMLQFFSYFSAVIILASAWRTGNLVIFSFSIVIAYGVAKLVLLTLAGLTIRFLPKPKLGQILNDDPQEMFKLSILTCVTKYVRRSIVREDYYCMPFPGGLFFKLCGAKIGGNVLITSAQTIQDPYLIEIGKNSDLGEGSMVSSHYGPNVHTIILGRVIIGSNVLVGSGTNIWANVTIGDGAVIQENSSVAPGTTIGTHEIWGGNPAKKLWGPQQNSTVTEQHPTVLGGFSQEQTASLVSVDLIHRDEFLEKRLTTSIDQFVKRERNLSLNQSDYNQPILFSGILDSLALFGLFTYLEQQFGLNLDIKNTELHHLTIQSIVQSLSEQSQQPFE